MHFDYLYEKHFFGLSVFRQYEQNPSISETRFVAHSGISNILTEGGISVATDKQKRTNCYSDMKKVVIIVVNEQEYLPEVQQIVRNDIHFSPENDGRDCTIDVSQPITRELRPLNKDDLIFHLVSTYFSVLVAAQTHKEPRSDYL